MTLDPRSVDSDTPTAGGGHPWLQPGRRAAVLAAVNAQLEQIGDTLPIDVESLALELHGLRTVRISGLAGKRTPNVDGTPLSGLLDFTRGRIYVEADNDARRQRFTIAHELGHFLLGHHELLGDTHADAKIGYGGTLRSIEATHDPLELAEREANRFAGLLLIPPDTLDAQVAEIGVDVVELARRFDVSAPAIRVHLSRYLHPHIRREQYR
jgi:Zn-dependent peptidase ImmA (M78 family)